MTTDDVPDLSPRAAPGRSTERMDGVIAVTRTRVWVALVALAVTVAGLAVWATLAEVSVTEDLQAVAISGGAFTQVVATDDGVLIEFLAPVGTTVAAGDAFAAVMTDEALQIVAAPVDGLVITHVAGVGAVVSSSDRIALIEAEGTPSLRSFVPLAKVQQLNVGDEAIIKFEQLDGEVIPVEGAVSSVAPLPLDVSDVGLAVGDDALATLLVGDAEAVIEVALEVDAGVDLSSLQDDRPDGVPPLITADVTIVLQRESPLEFILP